VIASFIRFHASQQTYHSAAENLLHVLEEIEKVADSKVEGESENITEIQSAVTTALVLVVIISLAFTIIASHFITNGIVGPLNNLMEICKKIAGGDLTSTI